MSTLGDLTAHDIGATIEFTDGGATYRGELSKVDHSQGYGGLKTLVVIVNGDDWRHIKSYPSETEVTITVTGELADARAALAGAKEVAG